MWDRIARKHFRKKNSKQSSLEKEEKAKVSMNTKCGDSEESGLASHTVELVALVRLGMPHTMLWALVRKEVAKN